MSEMTSGISVLLGSAVVSTIITTLFNQYNNRKSNTLKYITEERKAWREGIRSIGEKIQKCEFKGKGNKDIEKYLIELEVNINSYGRGNPQSAKEDAYLWNEIDDIRAVDNEETFNKHKELLIYYISLMIKADWDRAKNEVVGYSQKLAEMLTIIFINLCLGCYYLYVGKYTWDNYIIILSRILIYTVAMYVIFKEIQAFSDILRIKLSPNIHLLFIGKMMGTLLVVIRIIYPIMGYLFSMLNDKFSDECVMNWLVCITCYVEAVKIFWNWFENNIKKYRFSLQLIYNRRKILNENDIKIKMHQENMEELYQYIKYNQDDLEKIKKPVVSLRKIFKEYEKDIQKCIREESIKVMTKETRNKIDELENNLKILRQYKRNIEKYYDLGLINKIPDIVFGIVNLGNKILVVMSNIKNFFYKKRERLE